MHRHFAWMAMALGAGTVAAACSADVRDRDSCYSMIAPGVVVYMPGIDLTIRDAARRGIALGTTVTVHRGADSVVNVGYDTLRMSAGYAQPGTFSVRVSRPFYRDTVVSNVTVLDGRCAVVATTLPITMQLSPGAPAIRSVSVLNALFLLTPGSTQRLVARVDANPGVPTAVMWRLGDTTLARIDTAGVVTSKCTLAGGTETVTAVATADTTVRGAAQFGVAKQIACP